MGRPPSQLTIARANAALSVPVGAEVFLGSSVRHLDPPRAVFDAMLAEFDRQQAARGLAIDTRRGRERVVRQLKAFAGAWPWEWTPAHFDAWSAAHLRDGRTKATLRGYQNAIVAFCDFIADSRYRWGEVCAELFSAIPARVVHELNRVKHKGDYEGRPDGNRPFTRVEQDRFFTVLDERARAARLLHRKGAIAAHRDAAMFLHMLGWGTRRTETSGLDVDDFRRNNRTPAFGRYGALVVRNAKSFPGGPPRRRTVLTAFPWAAEIARHWIETSRLTCYPAAAGVKVLFPTERGRRISPRQIDDRFAAIRAEAGLPDYLNPHCLRHTYATTLIEMGWPMALVQDQLGHTHVATTAVYTALSDDFKDRVLYRSLGLDWDDDDPEHPVPGPADPGSWHAVSGPAYEWKLRELMAMRGMFSTSDLIEPLARRGIDLSRSQVYRLVAETPERVQVSMLLALCDILGCQLTDIAVPVEEGTQRPRRRPGRKKAAGEGDVPASPAVPREFFSRP